MSKIIDLDYCELQKMTEEGEYWKREIEDKGKNNAIKKKEEEERERYEGAISKIPMHAKVAATRGERKAAIMDVMRHDYIRPKSFKDKVLFCDPEWLKNGPCKKVFKVCGEEGYKPTIEHKIDGIKSGFEIVIHW